MRDQGMQLYVQFKEAATIKRQTPDGLSVCAELSELGIRTNVTLVFNAAQALLAAKAGATRITLCRCIDDQGYAGLEDPQYC